MHVHRRRSINMKAVVWLICEENLMQIKRIYDDYAITEDGRVFSYKGGSKHELTGGICPRGPCYRFVNLRINGETKPVYVHRLVAEAFIPNPSNYPQINHKDRNSLNNNVDNLEWCTNSQNQIHRYKTDPYKECLICGTRIHSVRHVMCRKCITKLIDSIESSLTIKRKPQFNDANRITADNEMHFKILHLHAQGYTYKEIGEKFGLSRQRMHQIVKEYAMALNNER